MELWALMNFQDCLMMMEFNFIFYTLWLKLQGSKQAFKFDERDLPMGKIRV